MKDQKQNMEPKEKPRLGVTGWGRRFWGSGGWEAQEDLFPNLLPFSQALFTYYLPYAGQFS